MRVLIYGLNFHPEWTGTGKYTGELAGFLAENGHSVHVVTAPPYYPDWRVHPGYHAWGYKQTDASPQSATGRLRVYRCPLWVPRRPTGVRRVLHLFSFVMFSLPVMATQIFWRPEVTLAVVPTIGCAPAALLVSWLSGSKSWLHIQDFEIDAAFGLGLLSPGPIKYSLKRIERGIFRRFLRVSTISDRMRDRVVASGVDPERVCVLENWADLESIVPLDRPSVLRSELGIANDRIVVLYSGNMGNKQGLEVIPDLVRRLQSNTKIQFVLCGEGSFRRRLEQLCQGARNVRFLPLQPPERLGELLNLANIHLLPQRQEAEDLVMPSKLTGMMASGRPVIATVREGTQVAQAVEGRGIVVPPASPQDLAEAILGLANDPDRRKQLGINARAFAERRFSRRVLLQQWERLVRDSDKSGTVHPR